MSINPSKKTHKDESLTSLIITGGRDCKPGVLLSQQNPDLWVKGGAIIEKNLCVGGNIGADGVIQGTFVGNVITNSITAENLNDPIVIFGDVDIPAGNVDIAQKLTVGNLCVLHDAVFLGNVYGINITGNITGNIHNIVGDLTITGNLTVLGDTILETLTVNTDAVINGNLSGIDKLTVDTLCVLGDTMFFGNTTISGPLVVDDDVLIKGNLTVLGDSTLTILTVNQTTTLNGDTTMNGNTLITGPLTIDDDVLINGNLTVLGDSTLTTLTVVQDAVINGNLSGIDKLTVDTLCVLGDTMLFGNTTISGPLVVDDDVLITGNLTVLGDSTLTTLTVVQDAVINGNLSGIDMLNVQDLVVTNNTIVGNIVVTGTYTGPGAVLDSAASPTYPQNLNQGVWYGLNTKANAFDATSITIGQDAITGNTNTIAIGTGANADSADSIAIGANASSIGTNSVAINGNVHGFSGVAIIGDAAPTSIAILGSTGTMGVSSIALLGFSTDATSTVVLGDSSLCDSGAHGSVCVGFNSNTKSLQCIAIGQESISGNTMLDQNAIAVGTKAEAFNLDSIAIGYNTNASFNQSIALGSNITTNQTGGFFVRHRGPLAVTVNPAGFVAGTNELVEITSSRRFKQNIRDLESVSDRIDALRAVRYEAKPGFGDDREHIGFIAEEVQAIFPEFVTFDDEGNVTGMMFDRVTSVLLKEIQSIRARLAAAGL